ncbi:arylamine N-acetyltransferase family protein [Sphaerisporangium corydalis]|uniref:Arylamine N-acetyltransferase n=1 Tax=Sphaerisporangium corydalis TaxID=1441875 RepID=A0ABV9E9Z4_9ACTN|nr:arylamine N-acetyltransferase [Sphaerisporangium corydalis]
MTRSLDVPAYLNRLGLGGLAGPPSVESLVRLHTAHVERVPYEFFHIWLGRHTTVDPVESAGRVFLGRGGYCFHLNGAFALLLEELGYQVTRHNGVPRSLAGHTGHHVALTVSGLPSHRCPDGVWFVDVGLGDGIHEPLPLVEGIYRQGPFQYRLRRSDLEPGGWRFDHDPRGSFHRMDFRPEAAVMSQFKDMHTYLSTSRDTAFWHVLTVQRRDAAGVDCVRGLVLSRIGSAEGSSVLSGRRDYFEALADIFGLTLDDVTPGEKDALWGRLSESHEKWLASAAPRTDLTGPASPVSA